MRVKANGIEMEAELQGQGPVLVLIHGFSDNLTMWYNQVPVFSKTNRVLVYNVRGHGGTETSEIEIGMDLLSEDLRALLDALEIEKACVLGYSMGGRIGLGFALKYPGRTAGLILANSGIMGPDIQPSPEEAKAMMARRQEMLDMIEMGNIEAIASGMAERSLSPGFRERNPEVFKRYEQVKMKNSPLAYKAMMEGMAKATAEPPDLSQLKCPVLIIAGEHDGFMAIDVARSMGKRIKDATVAVFPTGHAAAIEAPEEFNRAVLDFLKTINWFERR